MTCQRCGNLVQPEDQYCGSCGAANLPPAPQVEQVITEPPPAAQSVTTSNVRRPLLLTVALGSVLLLFVGGSALALLRSGGEEVELASGISAEVPEGWAVDTSAADLEGVVLVPKGYENQSLEASGARDKTGEASSQEATLFAGEASSCVQDQQSLPPDTSDRIPEITSGYDKRTAVFGDIANGEATVAGHPATWDVGYSASAMPWFMPGSTIFSARPATANYPNYTAFASLGVCVEDLNLSISMLMGSAALSEHSNKAPEDKPTSSRNATVPEAREEVHEELRQRYEANVGAMVDLLNSIDTDSWDGDTDLSEIPTSLDGIDQQLSDPFKGQLKDTGKSGTTKEKTSPPPKGKTAPKKDGSPGNKKSGAGKETTTKSKGTSARDKAGAEKAAGDYYRAAGRQDFDYTYDHLDSQTWRGFTREEWRKKNEWFVDNGSTIYNIESVNLENTSQKPLAEVAVRLTGEDGSSSIRNTYFVFEDGEWKHRFAKEENDLYKPDLSYEEFLDANQ